MKKTLVFLVVVSLLCVFFAGSCKKTSQADQTKANALSSEDANLKFIRPGHSTDKEDDPYNRAFKKYEEKYNAKVEVVSSDYNNWQSQLDASIASGDPIDIVTQAVYYYDYLTLNHRTQPINEYIDLNDKNLSKEAMDMFYTYNGKYYCACPADGIYPALLFYNKDMLANEGLDDPADMYYQGNWTWDTFRDMCKQLKKTNNDGSVKQYALAMWYPNLFLATNHTSAAKFENGRYSLNFDDPALKNALNYSKDFYYDSKYRGVFENDIYQNWYECKAAFVCEYCYALDDNILKEKDKGTFTFDFGVVGMPYGPENTEKYNPCHSDSVAIVNGSHSPYHAGQLITMAMQEFVNLEEENNAKRPADAVAMIKDLQQRPYTSTYTDSVIDQASDLMALVDGGKSADEALSTVKNGYQSMIDDTNKEIEDAEAGNTPTQE